MRTLRSFVKVSKPSSFAPLGVRAFHNSIVLERASSFDLPPEIKGYKKYAKFDGKMYIIGFGSIGPGTLPLILRHIDIDPKQITILSPKLTADHKAIGQRYGVAVKDVALTKENYLDVLGGLSKGDFIVNVSVDVSSFDLMKLAEKKDALYIDTCIEPWAGFYTDATLEPSQRSNYALRDAALQAHDKPGGPTAIITHGANPGLVSHFGKQALLNIARDTGETVKEPTSKAEWADLANHLGIKVVHIAERDTQASNVIKRVGEFVNTWSIDGFVSEGCQPAELGWGTHEKHFPEDGRRHNFGCGAAIFLNRPGVSVKVRTWTPQEGPFHALLITHSEAIGIADYYTVKDGKGKLIYRPTVHYSYHPSDDTIASVHELVGKNYKQQKEQRLMSKEIVSGTDELGVLLAGHKKGAYWFGSTLSIGEARKLCPYNNATSLQVCSPVLSGIVWAIKNPKRGVVEPDDMDYKLHLEICSPYLGKVEGTYTDWTPLVDRSWLFPEDLDTSDPWQFKNIRVV